MYKFLGFTVSDSFLGVVRGVGYPLIGYAIYLLVQTLAHNGYISGATALVVLALIGKVEHKFHIPVYTPNAGTTASKPGSNS